VIAFSWFGWISLSDISFWAPMPSGAFLGIGIIFIILALYNYVIDAHLAFVVSALASMAIVRSLFGAGFPVFSTQMYERLGPRWASLLLGFITLLLVPIPFVLAKFGPRLRAKSKYAPEPWPLRLPSILYTHRVPATTTLKLQMYIYFNENGRT